MDGTLVDSAKAMTKSINYVRSRYDLEAVSVETIKDAINTIADANLAQIFYGTEEYLDAHRAYFKESYTTVCQEETELFGGVYEMLEALSRRYKIAVATNANHIYAELICKAHGIEGFVDYIVGSNMVNKGKPDPEMLHYVLENLGGSVEKSVMVGDTFKDKGAAVNAGMEFIYVDWGFGKKVESKYTASNAKELGELISQILS